MHPESYTQREYVAALARRGLVSESSLEARALEALGGYVGDTGRLRGNIEGAARIIAANSPP